MMKKPTPFSKLSDLELLPRRNVRIGDMFEMDHPRILVQLDSDPHASVFDAIVAIDSGTERLLQYANVEPTNVQALVHDAMFTRGPLQLKNTAVFVGGSDTKLGDTIAHEVRQCFFGPVSVSVMVDGNGSTTTAAAAVLSAARHVDLSSINAILFGGTGPVGLRVARMILQQGGKVQIVSREIERAQRCCDLIASQSTSLDRSKLTPLATTNKDQLAHALAETTGIFSCGAAGVEMVSEEMLSQAKNAIVAIDLNAVPPAGIASVGPADKAVQRGKRFDYGAIGVGGLKMKIHREAIATLFTRNDLFLDAEEIFAIGQNLELAKTV